MALSLVIDDEQVVCDMLSTILARYGYEVETAEDGASALALFAARREEIGLVLLDLSMPKMSGVEVLDQIKASAPEIPVAVMTGFADPAEGVAGADEILYKPFRLKELVAEVRKLLGE